jgi:2-polyprenyl-6-methoxyphenol hydroxylase-like FAD-dependent oxidoreductase
MKSIQTRCVVVGGGPAGMMLGFLLARAGVEVMVMEKHADFIRDFRGDTIHPSTLELMHQLGLLEEFLKQPHQETRELRGTINGHTVPIADFSKLPTHCKFIAFMPQWDFLNFLSEHAGKFPGFHLCMEHEVTDLLRSEDGGQKAEDREQRTERVVGVRAKTPQGEVEVRADLVVGADGRHATTRLRAHFEVQEFGVPIDVLWMRISKREPDPAQSLGFFDRGKLLVLLDRSDYWQCGVVIPKDALDEIKMRGLPAFQQDYIAAMAPFLRDRVAELDGWSKIKLLTVQINRLREWCREGLLCIGDAAHAMSPAGGVGINLAIQDAVAAANLLAGKLRQGAVSLEDLRAVQKRREWPTRVIQRMQVFVHRRITTGKTGPGKAKLPFVVWLLKTFPVLRQVPARFIGIGPRPEKIEESDEGRVRKSSRFIFSKPR